MVMDRSKKVGSVPRRNMDGASGKTGNALGPVHMGGLPAGRAQVRGQATSQSGVYKVSGKRGVEEYLSFTSGLRRTFNPPEWGPIRFLEDTAGTYDLKQHFTNASSFAIAASAWPSGVTMSAAGVLTIGASTTQGASYCTVTVTGKAGDTMTVRFNWYVYKPMTSTLDPGEAISAAKVWTEAVAITAVDVGALFTNERATAAYVATGLPAGVTISANTGVISGTPSAVAATVSGVAWVTVLPSDPAQRPQQNHLAWTVTNV